MSREWIVSTFCRQPSDNIHQAIVLITTPSKTGGR